jgi:hypothetical protein
MSRTSRNVDESPPAFCGVIGHHPALGEWQDPRSSSGKARNGGKDKKVRK